MCLPTQKKTKRKALDMKYLEITKKMRYNLSFENRLFMSAWDDLNFRLPDVMRRDHINDVISSNVIANRET